MMRWLALLLSAACAACASGSEGRDVAAERAELRPDTPNDSEPPPRFARDDHVELFDSPGGSFRLHFTRRGEHAVPAADGDADGVPDYVQLVATEYDAVGEFYAGELGFERPLSDALVESDNGGDDRFDVYLLDFPTSSDGEFRKEDCLPDAPFRCTGYMLHENDFNGRNYPSLARASRILASHEYFHAIQSSYDADASRVLSEGTAVWASEQYDPTLNDLEGFVAGYLSQTERSLADEPAGPFDQFSYGSALFFQYLGERYGRDVIRELWETLRERAAAGTPSSWVDALDFLLRQRHDSALGDAFVEFTSWNLFTRGRTDPDRSYASGEGYPELEAKAVNLPYLDRSLRVFPLAARFFSVTLAHSAPRLVLRASRDGSGLRLLLAREVEGRIVSLQLSAAEATPSVTLDGSAAGDRVFAAVINPRLGGESARPDLCLGAPQACVEQPTDQTTPGSEPKSRGCSAAHGGAHSGPWLVALFSSLACLARRRPRTRRSPRRARAPNRSRS